MTALIEVRVAELAGPALDYAVAKAEGLNPERWKLHDGKFGFSPSTNWSQGGPLMTALMQSGKWEIVQGIRPGAIWVQNYNNECVPVDGESYSDESVHFDSDSLLVAACRATVWLKLGSTVSVPTDLVQAVQP